MATLVAILGVLVGVALLWAGARRLAWATPLAAVLSALDLLALVLAIAQLGWLGLALFLLANIVGFLGWGVAGAIYVDAQVAAASALGRIERDEVKRLLKTLNHDRALSALGPRRRAQLVRLLAERARTARDIEHMAAPLDLLWIIGDKPTLGWLVERFDTLLRLYGKDAEDAMTTADTLTVATQQSATTFEDMLEAAVVAAGGSASREEAEPLSHAA